MKNYDNRLVKGPKICFFQAEHALYTPGLDENRGSSDFVDDIWICYKINGIKAN